MAEDLLLTVVRRAEGPERGRRRRSEGAGGAGDLQVRYIWRDKIVSFPETLGGIEPLTLIGGRSLF